MIIPYAMRKSYHISHGEHLSMTWYAIDGLDGSGKTTAGRMLKDLLESRGRTVELITHPDPGRFFGRLSGRMLFKNGKPAAMFATFFFFINVSGSLARMRRRRTDDIIFIRYTMSACYLPEHLFKKVYRIVTSFFPAPDVRIYLDIDEDTAMHRIHSRGGDRERFENHESLKEVGDRMRSVSDGWLVVDARMPLDDVGRLMDSVVVSADLAARGP
jgi:dTMP kinase